MSYIAYVTAEASIRSYTEIWRTQLQNKYIEQS